ncbi:hypothetical protein U9M48_014557 [Paspalum notatum var. saurae]|uniref:Uncharacterized protein n=1 Tax=Paspalum notatum var. saurae TaxID=547442 RepID=A0AAQ3T1X7_PASNO
MVPFSVVQPLVAMLPTQSFAVQVATSNPQPGGHGFAPAGFRKCAALSDHGRQELRASDYQFADDEPLWLAVVRDLTVVLKALLAFLAEQPGQLKHLEWPGFQNTLKTATLTLILVAVFIVALSTVDAALCFMLAWLLRKST